MELPLDFLPTNIPEGKLDSSVVSKLNSTTSSSDYLADIYMIPSYGQSLAIGTSGGTTTFTTAPSLIIDETGANVILQDMNGGYAETFLSLSKKFKPLPDGFKLMTCVNGAGGVTVAELSKNSTYYNALITNIQDGKTYADGQSKTYNVPAICWTQGEEQMRTGGVPADYDTTNFLTELQQLQTDLDTDIKAITGQTNDVKFIMYQVGSHNPYSRYPRIAMEQLSLCTTNDNFVMAKTMYDVDYNADEVHAPNKTYRNMGNHYGIALYKTLVMNEDFKPIYPLEHFISGTDVYIKFNVPKPPLVFDTTLVTALTDANYGFNLLDVANENIGATGTAALSATTITAVSLYSEDTVKITMSGTPTTGTRLTYGVNGTGWDDLSGVYDNGGKSGRVDGARGNLRDSQTNINVVDDYLNLYNWSTIFEIELD